MIKIYKFLTQVINKRKAIFFCLALTAFAGTVRAQQVTLTASVGGPGTFSTLREAFTAINAGTYGGNITISINANVDEGSSPAVLNSSNADPASYTSITIRPTLDGLTVSGSPSAGFGVIELNGSDNVTIDGDNPNTGGTNRNLTISNTATNTSIGNSCIRIATSALVTTADNISIQNLILNGNVTGGNAVGITNSTTSSNVSFGIYCGGNGGPASDLDAPVAITSETANPAIAGTSINNLTVSNNSINQCGRAIVFNGAAASVSTGVTITNNTIGAAGAAGPYPFSSITSTVYTKAVYLAGVNAATLTGNTMQNIYSYINTNINAVEFASAIGTGTMNISNNDITTLANNGTAGASGAIFINSLGGPVSMTGNTIKTVIHQASGVFVSAIQVASNGGAVTISGNDISDVQQKNTGQYGAHGINLSSAANGAVIQNNFIYNILNTGGAAVGGSFGNNRNVDGILLASGSNHKIYHNSVSLYGASTANITNAINCLAITGTSQTGIDIRNNIFSNTVTGGSASDVHVCLFFPFAANASMNLTLNNNGYYTGSIANKSGMGFAAAASYAAANIYTVANFNSAITTPATNWRSFSTLLGNTSNDNVSFASTAAAPFISAVNLHIPAATLTQLESGGAALGVTNDIDLSARNANTPDIGADEFNGVIDDRFPPVITYTLPVTCGGPLNRVLTATITDATGVPTAGIGLPVLYWRVNAGAWTATQAVFLSPTQYQFTFDGVATAGQTVDYYIVAQDLVATPNIIASPSAGAGAYTPNPPAAGTIPTTFFSYTIIPSLTGTYNVGVGQAPAGFNTLTDAAAAYNVSCIGGPVTFLLMDATYSGSETFPITFNSNSTASAVNTLTIKPNTGVAANITGANGNALVKLNGADYITIDGLNIAPATPSLTIFNTNTGITATSVWIASASSTNGATNNTIKNCSINGSGSSSTVYGIVSGSGSALATAADAANSNNTITGNNIKGAQNGIFINGKQPTGFDQSWLISNNTIGSVVLNNDKMGARGICVQGVQNFTISGNTINGVIRPTSATGTASTASGISIFSYSQDGTIFNNKISDVKHLNTVGWGANGIHLGSNTTAANITVYNNFIWDIAGQGSTGVLDSDNGNGIMVNSGGGYNIYYNSVHMTTDQVSGSGTTAAINISSAITSPNTLNIRNNIFSNVQTVGARYAIYSGAAATVYAAIDNNDYYQGSSANLGFLVAAKTSLVAWQIATGKDVNSAAVNPLFTSATNLHLQLNSPMNARAVSIGTITTDIDLAARSGTTPDIGADEITPASNCTPALAGGVASSTAAAICVSGSTYLTATVFTTGVEGLSYQWEVSTDNITFVNLGTQTNPYSAFTGVIGATRYYRLRVNCSFGGTAVSNTVTITVNNPTVNSPSGATRCGPGTVNLTASPSAGAALNWYAGPTGGAILGSGSPFTTPSIASTTTYYVGASIGGSSNTVGAPNTGISTTLNSQVTTTSGINFDVLASSVTISSVNIYPTAAIGSTFRIDVREVVSGTIIATYTGTTTVSGTTAAPVAQTVPLGFVIPNGIGAGTNGYYRMTLPTNPGNIRNSGGTAFPYTVPGVISLVSSTVQTFYYNFYNWNVSSGCESARTPVVATVTPPPAMNTPVASPSTICDGQSSTLSVTSGYDPNYTYTWTPGPLPGASVTVSPSVNTTYTVNALATAGPNIGCTNVGTVSVSVLSSPVLPVVSNDTTICQGGSATLTAISNTPAFVSEYLFNASTGATLDPMAGSTIVVTSNVDDVPQAAPSNIGFTFNFNNTNYTQFSASPDGWMLLGGTPAVSDFINGVQDANNVPKIYPYWDDNATGSDGNVSYLLTGSAPNRILKVQWKVRIPRTPLTSPSNSLFQAWLYETINKIEFRYGVMATNAVSSTSAGLTAAPSTTNFQSITFTTNTSSNAAANNTNTGVQPPVGTMYTYTPPTPNITWTPTTNLSPTTGSPVTATPATTITYTATATNAIGCSRLDSVIVTVNPSTASVSIAAVPSGPICPNTSVTFTATPTNGGAGPTYQWFVGAAPVGVGSTYTTSTLTNGQVVTCKITSNATCVVGGPFTSNSITMVVNPNLPASVSIAAVPSGAICSGTSVTFTATPTNPGATPVYQWYVGAAPVGVNSPTYTSNTLTNGQVVTVQMTSNALCVTGSPATSNAINMVVNPNVTASVTIAASPAGSVCSGTSVTFTPTPTNGGAGPTYQWFVNNILVFTGPTYTTTTLANGDNVKAELTTNAPCATPIPATSNTITMVITGALPASVSIISSGALCSGNTITFTATPVNGGTPTYQWYVNTLPVGGPGNVYSYVPLNGDLVEVDMTTSLGCAAPAVSSSNQITVVLNASPNISSVTADCNNLLTGSGQQATLTAAATAGSGSITTYQWVLAPATNVGANSPTYTTSVAGSYTVIVTNSNGCSTTSSSPVVITNTTPALAAGTYTIPSTGCAGFDKISSAVNYINSNGISGAGGVIFNITPAYTETAPVGGYAITATGTAANPITFQRAGAGANPIITAGLQVAGTNNDGIFKIIGADYITIQDLTIRENPGNTVTATGGTNTMTEWAVALLYASTTNGPNNNTIQNNTISLNRLYANSCGIYSNLRHNATTVATPADITNTTGGSNKIYGNAISNVNMPVFFLSSGAGMSGGNDIGGGSAVTANTITNWGSNTAPNAGALFFGIPTSLSGIYAGNQTGLNISWNNITNAAGLLITTGFRGIYSDFISTAPTGTFTNSITNNTIALNSAQGAGALELISQANTVVSTAVAGITLNINNNNVSAVLTGGGSGSAIVGIINAFPAGVLSISDNISKGNTSTGIGFTGISNTASVATTINMNNNQLGDAATDAITFSSAATAAVVGITNTGATGSPVLTVSGNTLYRFNSGTGAITFISAGGAAGGRTVSGNTINTASGGGVVTGIALATPAATVSNALLNTISGLSSTGAASGVTGIQGNSAGTITNNTISNITASGLTATITGIQCAAANLSVSLNTINALTGSGGTSPVANGISILLGGAGINVFKNKIYNLSETTGVGGANPLVNGILASTASGSTTATIYNNFISDLKAPVANINDAIRGISVTATGINSNYFVYYNTVYLNAASSGANFGTTAIFHTGNATPTTAALQMRDNIIDNESVAAGTGLTVAFRKANTSYNNYALVSSNNLFFAGSYTTPGLLFYDGTNSLTSIAAIQATTAGHESNSITAQPSFVSTTDLHLVANNNCGIDGAGVPIAGITDDVESPVGDVRNAATPDIGADEFNGTGGGVGNWKGISSNWLDPQNWCGQVPTASMDVTIPNGRPFYPIITTATPIAKNVNIAAGGSITITGAGKLSIYGTIANAGTFNVVDGTIELPGTTAQTIPAAVFQNNDLKNLIISNTGTSPGVTLGGALNLYGKLSFTGNNKTFATGGFLILKSNAAGTASVGDITNNNVNTGNTVTGDVQVERFIKARRAWRFLSVPTMNNLQTIHEAWQENQAANAATPAGYGIQIISDIPPTVGNGFDLLTPAGPGVKTYNPVTNNWDGILSTMVPFTTGEGYMAIIRGDRVSNTFGSPVTTTVLRDKGGLVLGTYPGVAIPVPAAQFKAIGNPYASAIDFSKLTRTGGVQDAFYVWDPALGTLGAYQTFTGPGPNYSIAPGGGSYAGGNKFIESGEAFFVHTVGAGTLQFTEPAKVDGSYLVTRPGSLPTIQLRTNIYQVSGGTSSLFDGVLSEFDGSYSKAIDELDAVKMSNFGENIAIRNVDKLLSVERMPELTINDTIFYALNHLKEQSYQFEFTAENIGQPGLSGFLEDNYLHTSTLVNMDGITRVDFSVINDPGSYASDRFRLVFKQTGGPVPVTFTSVRANKQSNDILVEWKVQNELNIHHYEVEKSADGRSFNKVNEQAARGTGSGTVQYNWLDTNPWDGDNFYRIRSVGMNSETKYSQIVRVNMVKPASSITVFPNPVREDGMLYVSLSNKAAGNYRVSLVNSEGQVMIKKTLNHGGGSSVYSIMTERTVAHGNYLINIIGDDNVNLTFKIVY